MESGKRRLWYVLAAPLMDVGGPQLALVKGERPGQEANIGRLVMVSDTFMPCLSGGIVRRVYPVGDRPWAWATHEGVSGVLDASQGVWMREERLLPLCLVVEWEEPDPREEEGRR